jgi:hypothetical protein
MDEVESCTVDDLHLIYRFGSRVGPTKKPQKMTF